MFCFVCAIERLIWEMQVLKYEESAFYQAFGDLQISPSPGLTIVVIQKDTNYRIIPVDANRRSNAPASAQNVRPGTCVDNKIMSPIYTEFLLVPHKAIQVSFHSLAFYNIVPNLC